RRLSVAFPVEEVVAVRQQLLARRRSRLALGARCRRLLFVDRAQLLFERLGLVAPVLGRAELRPAGAEGGVVPAPRQPSCVAHEAQAAQRLDEAQRRVVEGAEALVAGEERVAPTPALVVAAG